VALLPIPVDMALLLLRKSSYAKGVSSGLVGRISIFSSLELSCQLTNLLRERI
jgi:hypothetical protein